MKLESTGREPSSPARLRTENRAAAPATPREDSRLKRLAELQEGLQRLREMPTPQAQARQEATNKVGLLKQRLDALKMLLLHASPEQARALARELKEIAGQLAAAARNLGGAAVGAAAPTIAASVAGGPDRSASAGAAAAGDAATGSPAAAAHAAAEAQGPGPDGAAAAAAGAAAAAEGEEAAAQDDEREAEDSGKAADGLSSHPRGAPADGSGQALRAALIEARKLLKQVIDLFKAKMAAAPQEARQDLASAQKNLTEIDRALQEGSGNDFYARDGALSAELAVGGVPQASSLSGGNINLSV